MNAAIKIIVGLLIFAFLLFGGASYVIRTALESITKHQQELEQAEGE